MPRLFIIGAGFSKAIANAPLANGFIKAIYKKSLNEEEKYKHTNEWAKDKDAFIKILKLFHDTVQGLINRFEKSNRKILNREFEVFLDTLNVEFACSFLDLHIRHCFIPKAKDEDMSGCPIPYIHNFFQSELESALKFINHYILDLLLTENLSIDTDVFNKMADYFREDDKIISFNYDLLVEQMLWKRKLWNPFTGYDGFEFKKNGNEHVHDSKTNVIKIHGSINWRSPDIFFHPDLELAIDHPFKNQPLFEGLHISKSNFDKEKYKQYPLHSYIVLPTFMKSPQYNWEISLINNSLDFCKSSDEIYILGYSMPDVDYITNLLFSTMKKDSRINIVLWDKDEDVALKLSKKLVEKYGFRMENITHENTRIEEWIYNDFKFLSYKKYLEDQKFIERIIKASDESDSCHTRGVKNDGEI